MSGVWWAAFTVESPLVVEIGPATWRGGSIVVEVATRREVLPVLEGTR